MTKFQVWATLRMKCDTFVLIKEQYGQLICLHNPLTVAHQALIGEQWELFTPLHGKVSVPDTAWLGLVWFDKQ